MSTTGPFFSASARENLNSLPASDARVLISGAFAPLGRAASAAGAVSARASAAMAGAARVSGGTDGRRMLGSGAMQARALLGERRSSAKKRLRASGARRRAFRCVTDQLDIAAAGDTRSAPRSADVHGALPVGGSAPELLVGEHRVHADLERERRHTDAPARGVAGPASVAPVIEDVDRHLLAGQRA